ncbi:MAG: TIGR04149 family rSAM-modified RiPP [Cytophagales bacterium]|nr:TIGR04149 family rSAM-modified RiPP [Cytophagales bacterium]
MKKLGKLRLNQLSKNEMDKREMRALKGGCLCWGCGCEYAGEQCPSGDDYWGGSSQEDNAVANSEATN